MNNLLLDIGGTNIKSAVFLESKDDIIDLKKVDTFGNKDKTKENFLRALDNLINYYINNYKEINFDYIKISIPGPFINKKEGILGKLKNLPLYKFNIKEYFEKKYKINVKIENDAKCFILGEEYLLSKINNKNIKNKNSGKKGKNKYRNLVGITLGTGVGIGIIIDNKLYEGRENSGELSNLSYKNSILEDYVSKRGLLKICENFNLNIKEPKEISNEKYRKIWEIFSEDLAYLLEIIILTLDPEIIILGGGISKSFKFFKKSLLNNVKKKIDFYLPEIKKCSKNSNLYGVNLI